jgi:hypothetical protein
MTSYMHVYDHYSLSPPKSSSLLGGYSGGVAGCFFLRGGMKHGVVFLALCGGCCLVDMERFRGGAAVRGKLGVTGGAGVLALAVSGSSGGGGGIGSRAAAGGVSRGAGSASGAGRS